MAAHDPQSISIIQAQPNRQADYATDVAEILLYFRKIWTKSRTHFSD